MASSQFMNIMNLLLPLHTFPFPIAFPIDFGVDARERSTLFFPDLHPNHARVPDRPSADLGHNAAPFRFHELFHPCPVRHPSRAHAPRPTVIAKESPPIDREGERLMIGNRKMGNRGRQVSHELMRTERETGWVVRIQRGQVETSVCMLTLTPKRE